MDVYQCIRERLTIRSFKPDAIPESLVRRMLRAARWAPSARNRQPWHFVVIRNRATLERIGALASSGAFIGGAPMAVAVVMDRGGRPEFDAGRALQQMELTAWAAGVGGCVAGVRGDENAQVKELLNIPDDKELVTVMAFGYPADAVAAGTKQRKPVAEIAHHEKFGQPYNG